MKATMRTELRKLFLAVGALSNLALVGCGGGHDAPPSSDEVPQSTSEHVLAGPGTQAYEAETASLGGGANIQSFSNASGGQVVGHLSVAGAYLQLRVDGGTGGTVSMTFRYSVANGFTSRLGLYVNGVRKTVDFPFTAGWNNFTQLTVSVKLVPGTNVIRLQHDASDPGGVHIDRVIVSAPMTPSTAVLSWNAANDSRVTAYRVYYGTASRTYLQSPGHGLGSGNTTYTATNLQSGKKYYFAVTAIDGTGKESAYSNEVTKTIP